MTSSCVCEGSMTPVTRRDGLPTGHPGTPSWGPLLAHPMRLDHASHQRQRAASPGIDKLGRRPTAQPLGSARAAGRPANPMACRSAPRRDRAHADGGLSAPSPRLRPGAGWHSAAIVTDQGSVPARRRGAPGIAGGVGGRTRRRAAAAELADRGRQSSAPPPPVARHRHPMAGAPGGRGSCGTPPPVARPPGPPGWRVRRASSPALLGNARGGAALC